MKQNRFSRACDIREKIHNHVQEIIHRNTLFDDEEQFAAYYTSKYLLQDTIESLIAHREKGFSKDPYLSYIEYWGVMQAIIIQQDALSEFYISIIKKPIGDDIIQSKPWKKIRKIRNISAGHPANAKRHNKSRTFMGRNFGDYSAIRMETYKPGNRISHPIVFLDKELDIYEKKLNIVLEEIIDFLTKNYPINRES